MAASFELWTAAVAGAAAALAWRLHAVVGPLAAGVSAAAVAAAAGRQAPPVDALAFAIAFAAVSVIGTAIGAAVWHLLDDDSDP